MVGRCTQSQDQTFHCSFCLKKQKTWTCLSKTFPFVEGGKEKSQRSSAVFSRGPVLVLSQRDSGVEVRAAEEGGSRVPKSQGTPELPSLRFTPQMVPANGTPESIGVLWEEGRKPL